MRKDFSVETVRADLGFPQPTIIPFLLFFSLTQEEEEEEEEEEKS